MKLSLKKILKILPLLKPGLVSGAMFEQADHFVFTGKEIGTYNDHICVLHPFRTKLCFSACSQDFYSLCVKLEKSGFDVVSLQIKENMLFIEGLGTNNQVFKGRMNVLTDIEEIKSYFDQFSVVESDWENLPDNFSQGVSSCLLSVSDDITDRRFSSIHVHKEYLISSDDVRITKFKLSSPIENSFVMPGFNLGYFSDFTFSKYLIKFPWIIFKSDTKILFCVRLVDEDCLLEFDDVFCFKKKRIFVPTDFEEMVDLCSIGDKNKSLSFIFDANSVKCEGKDDNKLFVLEKKNTNYKGRKIKFVINSLFLTQLFVIVKKVKIFCAEEGDKILFVSEEFEHLIALMREEE